MFAVVEAEMGVFIQTEILVQKIFFILDGIPLISVLHVASVINQLLKCNQDRVGTSL